MVVFIFSKPPDKKKKNQGRTTKSKTTTARLRKPNQAPRGQSQRATPKFLTNTQRTTQAVQPPALKMGLGLDVTRRCLLSTVSNLYSQISNSVGMGYNAKVGEDLALQISLTRSEPSLLSTLRWLKMSAKSSCTKSFKRCGTLKKIAKTKRTVRPAIALVGFTPRLARRQAPKAFTTNKTKTSQSSSNSRIPSWKKASSVQIVSNSATVKIFTLKIQNCFLNFKDLKTKWWGRFSSHTILHRPKVTSGISCGLHVLVSRTSMKDLTNTKRSTNSLTPKKSLRKTDFVSILSVCKKNLVKQPSIWRPTLTYYQKSSETFTTTIKSSNSMSQKRTYGSLNQPTPVKVKESTLLTTSTMSTLRKHLSYLSTSLIRCS